ncbi:MAG: hypothetical protein IJ719_02470 [Clostridia bacterium]|nr:hypothetical protein [Clostridia bacterium]
MGKGAGSGVAGGKTGAGHTKDLKELREYMESNYGVLVGRSLERVEFALARDMAVGMEEMLNEFPDLRELPLHLEATLTGRDAYAGATVDGGILLQPDRMRTSEAARAAYDRDLSRGYHPAGTSYMNISVHEMGHQIEAALLHRRIPGTTEAARESRLEAWRASQVAEGIVSKALDRAMPEWRRNSRLAAGAIRGISGYAATNASETMAEAISDVFSNRHRAKPLSRAIWNVAKEELAK